MTPTLQAARMALMQAVQMPAALAAYNPPPMDRMDMLHEGLAAAAIVAGAFLIGTVVLVAVGRRRGRPATLAGPSAGASPAHGGAPQGGFAKQDQAHEDVVVERELRSRSRDRKIALGRDVDDGILESISSVAGALESSRVMIYTNPHAYEQQVRQCVAALNKAVRDLRACVVGLSSKVVRTAEFTEALGSRLAELKAEHGAQFDTQIDEDAVAVLGAAQLDGLLDIAREAVGNALLHGKSKIVSLKLRGDGHSVTFVTQDNGRGFSPDLVGSQGRGILRMRALAEGIGGKLDVTSRFGNGTRVVVTIPVARPVPFGPDDTVRTRLDAKD